MQAAFEVREEVTIASNGREIVQDRGGEGRVLSATASAPEVENEPDNGTRNIELSFYQW